MIRVLIVDDEFLVRVGLKTIIPWEQNGFELVGEAANGVEALHILKQQECHIVLTDIRMPNCDGLQLLEEMKSVAPQAKCMILSNHNDFAYVQKALRLGAVDYILKLTIEPEELLEKLNQLKESIELETVKTMEDSQLKYKMTKYGKEAREKRIRELLVKQNSTRSDVEEVMREFNLRPYRTPIYVVNFQLDHYNEVVEQNKFQSERLLHFTVANILTEIFKKYGEGELIEIENGKYSIIVDHLQDSMLHEVQEAVAAFLEVTISIGVSAPVQEILDVHQGFIQASEALSYRFYEGEGAFIYFEHIQAVEPGSPQKPWSDEDWERLVEKRDAAGLQQKLDEGYEAIRKGPKSNPEHMREAWVHLVHLLEAFARKLGGDLYSVPLHGAMYPYHAVRSLERMRDIYLWFHGWLPVYLDQIRLFSNQQYRPEIQAVINTIKEQFDQPLKVSELAKKAGFTENYLSVLFKKETSETIMDYLIRLRMSRARELLKDQAYKIYEISEMVGYGDSTYFSKLFKKMEGVYPLEYRKLYLGKSAS
ncbi:response regulator [Paenibacillus anseongense]|uniref:response regulator n=1 Tax=Paenibacillus TaxID=44249 RepID=UPI002DB67076|nr:response regulator [Paenibacillus anseongense]MEC0267321.1 response regulator [Paenibacillus anseongense]